MLNTKYTEDIRRCKRLGELLEPRIMHIFGSRRNAAKIYSELSALEEITAYDYLSSLLNGHEIARLSSELYYGRNKKFQKIHLRRLALFYGAMGLEEESNIVSLTRQINHHFEYTINDQHLPKETSGGENKLHLTFSPYQLSLTQEQLADIWKVALNYARQNMRNKS